MSEKNVKLTPNQKLQNSIGNSKSRVVVNHNNQVRLSWLRSEEEEED